jgi:hypothetical protein
MTTARGFASTVLEKIQIIEDREATIRTLELKMMQLELEKVTAEG